MGQVVSESPIRRAVLAFSIRNRRHKAQAITRFVERHGLRTAVLVGGLGGGTERNEGEVERHLATSVDVVAVLEVELPALPPWPDVLGDGRALPLRSDAVDLVVSNAVVEHVGDEADQLAYVAEHLRVGRAWVVTTPNRWFPVESHTSTVLRHWSPTWRAQRPEFTRLLSRREFRRLLPAGAEVVGRWWSPTFMAFGVKPRPGTR